MTEQLYTNYGDISLPMAVWLAANDGYDLKRGPKVVSATTLLKPLKSVVLGEALARENKQGLVDVQDLIPSRLGTAVHTAVEVAWTHSHVKALKNLGMAPKAIEMIKVNPDPKEVTEDDYPVYLEIRSTREVLGYTISGKFDIVENGRVKDVKSTKVFNWVNGSNDEKYIWQLSIYRWLNQDIITDDFCDIEFLLTDWSSLKAQTDKNYPSRPLMTKTLPLKTLAETENFIYGQIRLIDAHMGKKENEMPQCTPEEVWQRPTTWAFFTKAANKRATKVFDNASEAYHALAAGGNVGRVDVREGAVKFCSYCPARPICKQAEDYQMKGLLDL